MKKKKINIVMAGGGSGGHVFPLLNVYEVIKDDYEVLFIGERNGKEKKWVEERNVKYQGVYAGKLRRYFSFQNFVDFFKFPIGFFQSLIILNRFKPKMVFVKGGYVSLPVALAAWILRKPILAHESDMVMGLANKIISRMAQTIAVSFPIGAYDNKYAGKMIFTGLPVKAWKAKSGDLQKMKKILQIDLQLPTIFVTGGSYGAKSVNSYILEHASKILNYANILHVTGDNDYDRVIKLGKNIKGKGVYNIYKFLTDDFNKGLFVSDMVISRASATTLAEISSMAKPSILIPLPTSASNHQYFNAKSFEDMGASIMIEERDFPRINLAILIKSILEDEERYEEMSASAVTAMQTEGAAQIIKDIIAGMIGE